MNLSSQKTTVVSFLTAVVLVTALLGSIAMIQANNAFAARGNIIYQDRFSESVVQVVAESTEGDKTARAIVTAFENPSRICVYMVITDSSTGDLLSAYFGCRAADQLNIANGLTSATFSGTVTITEFNTGEEKTVTVNGDFTATEKPVIRDFNFRQVNGDYTFIFNEIGMVRPASGSLTITDTNTGDLIISAADAAASIGKVRSGTLQVLRG